MIKNLLFDLAGVLLNLDIEKDTKALLQIGLPDFEGCLKRPEIFKPVLAYLNGLLCEEYFLPQIRPFCNPSASDEEILWSMDAVLGDFPVSRMKMLVELRKKYKVYLLSNLNERDWKYTLNIIDKAGYSEEMLFEKAFISYKMQLAKPDHRIFEEVMKQTGIKAEETIYIDDTKENIEVGKELGFEIIHLPMNELEKVFDYKKMLEE